MCLAIPGRVIELATGGEDSGDDPTTRVGTVDFNGSRVEVSLALVPEAVVGSWVLVHAGFALNTLDETEARETWKWLQEAELVDGLPPELAG